MKLRARLLVTTLTVSVPMVCGLVIFDAWSRRIAAEQELTEFTRALIRQPRWLERCESDLESWAQVPKHPGGLTATRRPDPPLAAHRAPAKFWGYDDTLRSRQADAPELDPALQRGVDALGSVPVRHGLRDSHVRVLVAAAGAGSPCALVLAEGTTEPWLGGILPASPIWLLPLAAAVLAIWVVAGPVVRRIRTLEAAVLRSAESSYAEGVALQGADELTDLARSFDAAAKRVRDQLAETRRNEGALRDFLANTTHDIMIPLTVLQGHLSELQGALERSPRGVGQTVVSAMNEAHYLGALVNNLSMAAKLEAAEIVGTFCPVELGSLVERVVARHRPIAAGLGVALDWASSEHALRVRADITMLEQALGNVVYNAVRYNRPGGHVAVVVEPAGERAFELSVVDDGPGLPDALLGRLAERGFRADAARSRARGGQGLGLHIASRIARAHGFELIFEHSEHGGLRVAFLGELARSGDLGPLES